jgi:hypothetical protein
VWHECFRFSSRFQLDGLSADRASPHGTRADQLLGVRHGGSLDWADEADVLAAAGAHQHASSDLFLLNRLSTMLAKVKHVWPLALGCL